MISCCLARGSLSIERTCQYSWCVWFRSSALDSGATARYTDRLVAINTATTLSVTVIATTYIYHYYNNYNQLVACMWSHRTGGQSLLLPAGWSMAAWCLPPAEVVAMSPVIMWHDVYCMCIMHMSYDDDKQDKSLTRPVEWSAAHASTQSLT